MAELSRSWIRWEGGQVQIDKGKFTFLCSSSPQKPEFGHFTSLFCRERQRNVPKCKTHVQVIVLLIKTYCFAASSLLSLSWFRKVPVKVVFHSRMNFFSFSWTEIVFAPLHKPSSNNINYNFDWHTVAMETMLWTSTSEKRCTSLKKDISKSKRPAYMKQSLIQPTMVMLCHESQKQ